MAGTGSGRRRRRRGRQEVRRHYRPSLGRWVETYDRRGEHARPKTPRRGSAAGLPADDPQEPPSAAAEPARPPRRRRRLVALSSVVVLLVTAATLYVKARGAGVVEYVVLPARPPVVLEVEERRAARSVAAGPRVLAMLADRTAERVLETARENPGRLIVLDLVAPPLRFGALPSAERRILKRQLGSAAAEAYESAVAGFLERVLAAAEGARISVLGLPAEPRREGADAAAVTNDRYRGVLDRLEHLVTAHVFFRRESWLTEDRLVKEAIPEAIRRRAGRPVVFRLNLEWRVLVEEGELSRYRRSPGNVLTTNAAAASR